MARKPKDLNLDNVESIDEEIDGDLELSDDDNETSLELDEDDQDEKPNKGKARRKKKEPVGFAAQLLQSSSSGFEKPATKVKEAKLEVTASQEKDEESPAVSDEGTDISDDAPEKKPRRPRSTTEEKNLSVAMVSAFEAMTTHWMTAKLATDAMIANLEKVKKDLEEIKEASAEPLQKLVNQTKEKQAVASRVMFALSLGAIIFSFVSLTLSQSVRGQLLAVQTPAERPVFQTRSAPLSAPQTAQAQAQAIVPPQPRASNGQMPNANALASANAKSLARALRLPKSTKVK